MTKPSASHLDAAQRVLRRDAPSGDSGPGHAAAARRVLERTLADLGDVMGATAAHALLVRSLKLGALHSSALAAIAIDTPTPEAEPLPAYLERALAENSVEDVTEATTALYASWIMLLERLLGERLTAKLIRDVRPADTATAKEMK